MKIHTSHLPHVTACEKHYMCAWWLRRNGESLHVSSASNWVCVRLLMSHCSCQICLSHDVYQGQSSGVWTVLTWKWRQHVPPKRWLRIFRTTGRHIPKDIDIRSISNVTFRSFFRISGWRHIALAQPYVHRLLSTASQAPNIKAISWTVLQQTYAFISCPKNA
jgi:hypothetical protein